MIYIVFPLTFIIGLFAFSQILYPVLHSLPTIKKYKRLGLFSKHPPIWYTLATPTIWIIFLTGATLLINKFLYLHFTAYLVGLAISFVVILIQIPLKNKDLENDFKNSYRNYLKK